MEKLRIFLDNMFLSLPDTPEAREAKAHILEGMADRYEALLAQGKNENEAFGAVIGEFGSVEELRRELGLVPGEDGAPLPSPAPVPFPREEYEAFRKRFPVAIASGVILCVAAIAVSGVLSKVEWARAARLHHLVFLLMIAAATGLFVYFGIREDNYRKLARMSRDGSAPQVPEGEDANPLHGFIMLTATVSFLALGFFANLWHPGWIVFPAGAALCCLADAFSRRR